MGSNKEKEGVNLRKVRLASSEEPQHIHLALARVRGMWSQEFFGGCSRPNRVVDTTPELWYKSVQLPTLGLEQVM